MSSVNYNLNNKGVRLKDLKYAYVISKSQTKIKSKI